MTSGSGPKKPAQKTVIKQNPFSSGGGANPLPELGSGDKKATQQQRTVIGQMPVVPPAGGGHMGGEVDKGAADAWLGNARPTPPSAGQGVGDLGNSGPSFFPNQNAPQPQSAPLHSGPKVALHSALAKTELGASAGSNPITAAASNLLILFGRLRTQLVAMDAVPLMEHVTTEIETFERNMIDAGIDPNDVQVAKYAVCGTADDIVQNIPGTDSHVWMQYSMVARFFNRRTSGVGFFQEVDKALMQPQQKYNLLELMLTCLSLGFEGQYRSAPGGDVQLQNIRANIYATLRQVKARADDDVSPRWQAVSLGARRRFGGTPLWVLCSILGVILFGIYLGLRVLISQEGNEVAERLLELHPTDPILIASAGGYEVPEFDDTTQLTRVRDRLTNRLNDGSLSVDGNSDHIFVRVNNLILFASGRVDVKSAFADVAVEIAQALDEEPGDIRVVGHTDNIPLKGTGKYKNNFELSVARAESVRSVLEQFLADPNRIVVEGRGEDQPIADNASREGRAQNRRVEIMIPREETL